MEDKWEEYSLREVIISNQAPIAISPNEDYKQIKLRMYHNGVDLRDTKKGIELGSKQYQAKQGQFIVSKIDARNGAMGIVPAELDGAVVTGDFLLFDINDKIANTNFVDYYTRLASFDRACKDCSLGSTNRVRLKVSEFLNLTIPLPPLAEQRRIVAKVESIRRRIEEIRRLRREQEHAWATLLFSRYTEAVAEAAWRPMREVAPMHRRPVELDLDKTYYELGARSFGRGVFEKPTFKGSDLTWQKPYWIKAGDFLLSNIKAWEGAASLVPAEYDGWVGSHRYITCLPNQELVNPLFLDYFFKTQQGVEELSNASSGTADRNRTLNTKMLAAIGIPLPAPSVQQEFVALVQKVNAIREHYAQQENELSQLVPGLLDKAFKGEL